MSLVVLRPPPPDAGLMCPEPVSNNNEATEVAVGRRRGKNWVRVTRGLHRRADAADPRRAVLLAWQELLPDEAGFSGPTAAERWGWDLPPLPDALPVCVAMPYGLTAPTRPGQLRVTRHHLAPPLLVRDGLRLTSPGETLLTCAAWMTVLDLVVLIDSALRAGDIELLELRLLSRHHRRGIGRLRRAVALADAGAGSVMETLLRVLLVVCGLDVVSQYVVRDECGEHVAQGDLWLAGTDTLVEFDGAVHTEREQHRKDRRRDRRLLRARWRRFGYTDRDVFQRPVSILRDADEAVGRPYEPVRIRAWTDLFRESSFTATGRVALARRVTRPPAGKPA